MKSSNEINLLLCSLQVSEEFICPGKKFSYRAGHRNIDERNNYEN